MYLQTHELTSYAPFTFNDLVSKQDPFYNVRLLTTDKSPIEAALQFCPNATHLPPPHHPHHPHHPHCRMWNRNGKSLILACWARSHHNHHLYPHHSLTRGRALSKRNSRDVKSYKSTAGSYWSHLEWRKAPRIYHCLAVVDS